MRTIIISDITEKSENIIPYGLNVGKYSETKVYILHLIDPRLHEGPYSSFSDSQTFSPSEKLSHEQILEREKASASLTIDRILSREGSRLNYPLRIEHRIEITDVQTAMDETLSSNNDALIVSSSSPSRSSVKDLAELLLTGRNNSTPVLVVPAGKRFLKPDTALMVTTFSDGDADAQRQALKWLKPFQLSVNVYGIDASQEQIDNWKQSIFPDDPLLIHQARTLDGKANQDNLKKLIAENNPDIIAIPIDNPGVFGGYYLEETRAHQLVEDTGKPILFF
jgi:hypothetical protein